MRRERFRKGLEIKWRNRNFVIEHRNEDGNIQIRDILNNEFLNLPDSTLIDALFDGELEIINRNPESPQDFVDDLNLLPENIITEAKRRYFYVQKCVDCQLTAVTKQTLKPIIKEVAELLNDAKPPSWITLYRWFKKFVKSGQDIRSQIPVRKKGNTQRRFGKRPGQKLSNSQREIAEETAKIVDEVIKESFMTKQRLSVQATYDLLLIKISEINRFRQFENKLPVPNRDSFYKVISKLDEYAKDSARLGRRIADQKHLQRGIGPRPTRPLEQTEIDHTKIDDFLVDDNSWLPLGRPWITTLIDKYSSMVLGRYVSFEPPSSNSVLKCLLHAIRPKTYLSAQFPNIMNIWECYGLPEAISCDNGLEFLGKHFINALLQLGIHIKYSPVRMPWYKASIERFFGVQNKQLLHRLPGTTFSNIFEKGDYDPEKNGVIRFSAFLETLDTWIVDIYSQEIRRGYEQTGPQKIPALAWREGIEKYPPALPPNNLDLDVLLRMVEYRTVDQSGIELFSLRYNSAELSLIRRELKGEKVMVKYDSSDLSLIYVADQRFGKYIPVPALDQSYTKGLSLYQHEIIKKFTRNYLKSKVNEESLILAKKRVQDIVHEEINRSSKTRTRVRAARFVGINSKEKSDNRYISEHHNHLTEPQLPMLPPANFEETSNVDFTQNPTTEIFSSEISGNKKAKKRLRKIPNSLPEDIQQPDVTEDIPEFGTKSDLDLTGWGGNFNLPKRK